MRINTTDNRRHSNMLPRAILSLNTQLSIATGNDNQVHITQPVELKRPLGARPSAWARVRVRVCCLRRFFTVLSPIRGWAFEGSVPERRDSSGRLIRVVGA